jgi:hypothetical protein
MIENVPDIEENIDVEKVLSNLSQQYPQMYLDYPLVYEDFEYGYLNGMNSYEFKFASYLVNDKNLLVFREPKIDSCLHIPDFYVFNTLSNSGKLVELTLYDSDFTGCRNSKRSYQEVKKSIKRKQEQIDEIKGCGIPYVILYREQLENIRQRCIKNLF